MAHFYFKPKFSFLIALMALCLSETKSQQLPIFTQYRDYQGYINPASVTSEFMLYEQRGSAGFSYRKQWAGLRNSPNTQLARADYLWTPEQRQVSLLGGAYIINDQAGAIGHTGGYLRLAGVISEDPYRGGVALGFSLGAASFSIDLQGLNTDFPESIELPSENVNQLKMDVGVGLFAWKQLQNANHIYGGISVPQLLQPEVGITDSLDFKWQQHYYALAGGCFFLDNFSFIEPSVWVKYVPNAPVHVDLNIRWQWKRTLWLGSGLGTDGTLHFETGYLFRLSSTNKQKMLRVGYGLGYPVNGIGPSTGGSHELNLSYSFSK